MPPKNQTQRIDELLGGVTEELLLGNPQQFEDNSIRVERLLLEMVRPDPVQPRRVLPEQLHFAFHSNRLTPTQALKELVQLVQVAARQRGRPFNNVLELLPNPDDESDEEQSIHLSPEEQLLHDLVNLAITIRDDGQVNPLTVVDVSQGVTQQFRIETGERRYWATWLLRDFIAGYNGDGMIPSIIIPTERSSVFRQAKENTARAGLSAIAMARQATLLLLTVHGYEIPETAVTNDFYRHGLDLDLRGKREYTEVILSAMGGITKSQFSRYKALLHLSDEALELADRHGIEERKLRYILPLSEELHIEVMRQIIDFNLTSKQVQQICEGEVVDEGGASPNNVEVPRQVLKVARAFRSASEATAYELAHALIHQERSIPLAKARLQTLRRLLDEAEQYLVEE
jgi:hypothetical protein